MLRCRAARFASPLDFALTSFMCVALFVDERGTPDLSCEQEIRDLMRPSCDPAQISHAVTAFAPHAPCGAWAGTGAHRFEILKMVASRVAERPGWSSHPRSFLHEGRSSGSHEWAGRRSGRATRCSMARGKEAGRGSGGKMQSHEGPGNTRARAARRSLVLAAPLLWLLSPLENSADASGAAVGGAWHGPAAVAFSFKEGVARIKEQCGDRPNPGANLKSISHRCHPILVAFVWELTKETIDLPRGCLQGGRWSCHALNARQEEGAALVCSENLVHLSTLPELSRSFDAGCAELLSSSSLLLSSLELSDTTIYVP